MPPVSVASANPTALAVLTDRKLNARTILAQLRGTRHRAVFSRLMKEPLTARYNCGFFDATKNDHVDVIYQINRLLKSQINGRAVLLTTVSGKLRPFRFWVMILNPEIFDSVPGLKNLVPTKHITLADITCSAQRLIINHLAKNPHQKLAQVQEALGSSLTSTNVACQMGKGKLNLDMKRQGFPPPLLHTRTDPKGHYHVNPEFASLFNIHINDTPGSLSDLFDSKAQKLVNCLSNLREATAGQISEAIGLSSHDVNRSIRRLIARCAEIGLACPIERSGGNFHSKYKLTAAFEKRFKLEEGHSLLSQHFTDNLIDVIKLIAQFPSIRAKELCVRLNLSTSALSSRIQRIIKICNENDLPSLDQMFLARSEKAYWWNPDFIELFDELKDALKSTALSHRLKIGAWPAFPKLRTAIRGDSEGVRRYHSDMDKTLGVVKRGLDIHDIESIMRKDFARVKEPSVTNLSSLLEGAYKKGIVLPEFISILDEKGPVRALKVLRMYGSIQREHPEAPGVYASAHAAGWTYSYR